MEQCIGTLLLHLDGSVAACSEEIDGRCCPGADALHSGGTTDCVTELGSGGCETCAFELMTSRDWTHISHVARFASRSCSTHLRRRAARTRALEMVRPVDVYELRVTSGSPTQRS
ncbi:MAG: hypothetical protein ACYDD4_00625 [Acidimicrobiales bacterium]